MRGASSVKQSKLPINLDIAVDERSAGDFLPIHALEYCAQSDVNHCIHAAMNRVCLLNHTTG